MRRSKQHCCGIPVYIWYSWICKRRDLQVAGAVPTLALDKAALPRFLSEVDIVTQCKQIGTKTCSVAWAHDFWFSASMACTTCWSAARQVNQAAVAGTSGYTHQRHGGTGQKSRFAATTLQHILNIGTPAIILRAFVRLELTPDPYSCWPRERNA